MFSSIVLFILLSHSFTISVVIIALTHPAQIVRTVVARVPVYVVNGSADRRIGVRAESLCDQTAYKKMTAYTVFTKAYSVIPFVVHKSC